MRKTFPYAAEILMCAIGAAAAYTLHHIPRDLPETMPPGAGSPAAEPAASGAATAPAEPPASIPPAPAGSFLLVREPGGLDLPWRDRIRTGDQVELLGRWYRVVGPAADGEHAPGDWIYLAGERPAVEAAPYRVAIGGGR